MERIHNDNGNPPRVLVVDDEPLIRWSLHAELEERGLDSVEVEGLEAARRVIGDGFDLVVLDQLLPDGDGLAFLDEIRREHTGLPVVVLTAHGSIAQAVDAMKRGAYHYLCKTDDPGEVLEVITEALARRRDREEAAHGQNGASNGNGAHAGNGIEPGRVSLPPEGLVLDEVERDLLSQALQRTSGNRSRAARLLGITRNQIRYRIRKFGLDEARG